MCERASRRYANFFYKWTPTSVSAVEGDPMERAAPKHHVRGQNYHVLANVVSHPSNASGHATWTNLSLVASASSP